MEEPYHSCLHCDPKLVAFATRRHTSPSFPSFQVVFVLSCDFSILRWILRDGDSLETLDSVQQQPQLITMIPMSLEDYYSYQKSYALIKDRIRDWPIPTDEEDDFIRSTLEHSRNAVVSMKASDNRAFIHMHVTAELNQVFEETRDEVFEQVVRMVPADDSLIESLETMEIEMQTGGSCSVCLEEFPQGFEGVSLSCSHVFHQDCIKKWLKTSHFCPNCRFEMPY